MPKENTNEEAFHEAFGDLLKSEEPEQSDNEHELELGEMADPLQESLEDALGFGPEEDGPDIDWEVVANYAPPDVENPQWQEYVSRAPIPPLNREQEARAVAAGLEELRKTREYTNYIYRHMTKEFQSIYVTFPLLFQGYYDAVFNDVHEKISAYIEDMEHLIAGDINRLRAVKEDYKLFQNFEEKRLKLLHDILDFYNRKK